MTLMNANRLLHRLAPGALAATAWLAACQQDRLSVPEVAPAASVRVALEASALDAAPGSRITVAVRAETRDGRALYGVQGYVRFDAARLSYLGQAAEGPVMIVNHAGADAGELRLAAFNPGGLPARAGRLVFEVRGAGYANALRYDHEIAADERGEAVTDVQQIRGAVAAADLGAPAQFGRYTALEVLELLHPDVVALEQRAPQRVPGQYLLNLRYGDATLNGAIYVLDAAAVANAGVGNNEIIIGTSAPARDYVVAGNVRPQNGTGLGEPGDPVPPGQDAGGGRTINVLDAVCIANEGVGNDQTICGELIPGRGPVATTRVIVNADITANTTWTAGSIYEIQGPINVNGGATLTIEAGTRVEGSSVIAGSALFIDRDGRIVADGTPLQPIVMTCTAVPKTKGCWGGLWVAGNAPINFGTATSPVIAGRAATGGCLEQIGEGGAVLFGGCNPDDSSGVIRYLVEEYSGFIVSGNNELNGITLGGVGRNTVINNVHVHAGLDDGMEIFGGTVNVRNIYLTANSDDSFDTCCGWNGSAQFILIQHDSTDSDKGIESDNTEVSATYDAPGAGLFTTGQIFNLTFVGPEQPTLGAGANKSNDAFHWRRGVSQIMRNALVVNARIGLDFDDAATCTNIAGEGTPVIESSIFAGLPVLGNADGSDPSCPTAGGTAATEADFITLSGNQVHASSAGILKSPFDLTVPDYRPAASLPAGVSLVGAAPPNNGFFDITATFIGAVPQASGTGSNVPWYSGWSRSSLVGP